MSFSSVYLKYVNIVGARLERFQEVRDSLYRFRCPFCGDSKKKESKARGHFYLKDDTVLMKCFNCEYSSTFDNFLREYDINLYNEFRLEKLKYFNIFRTQPISFDDSLLKTVTKFNSFKKSVEGTVPSNISSKISRSSKIIEYVESRKIPSRFYDYLYETDIAEFAQSIERYKGSGVFSQKGLLIPFFYGPDSYHYALFRSIKSKFFMVFEVNEMNIPKIWGMNLVDSNKPVFVTESPIDAMMINNSIAMGGVGDPVVYNFINKKYDSATFILDNDYRTNMQVKKRLQSLIVSNSSVVIYDRQFNKFKDLNDAIVKGGWSYDDLENYLSERTFQGPRAMLELVHSNK
jgi:transcription elongation factor Elf1